MSWTIFFGSGQNRLWAWFCCRSRWRDCRWGWFSIIERSWFASRQTTGFPVLSCFVSSSTLKFVLSWEKRVWEAPLWGQTTVFTVLSWSGFGFGCLDWELLDCRATSPSGCRATSEPNSFIQSCFKEIFGRRRGDAYTFSYMTSPTDAHNETIVVVKTRVPNHNATRRRDFWAHSSVPE